jgi:hypothetical protein
MRFLLRMRSNPLWLRSLPRNASRRSAVLRIGSPVRAGSMGSAVWLSCTGLDDLDVKTHSEVVVRLRQVLEPLCKDAGKTLTITKGDHRRDLNLDFDSETDTRARELCPSRGMGSILGEDAGEAVFVRAHQDLRVCGPADQRTKRRDTRRFLTTSWLLGPAMANTALHELGHFIAKLEHTRDSMNIMFDGAPPFPVAERNIKSQREFWGTPWTFNDDQKQRLVAQLKTGVWLNGMTMTSVPGTSVPGTSVPGP